MVDENIGKVEMENIMKNQIGKQLPKKTMPKGENMSSISLQNQNFATFYPP